MFPKVLFSSLLFVLLAKFSSQEFIYASKCNDKCAPTQVNFIDPHNGNEYTSTFKMESSDPFEPILSLTITDHHPYNSSYEFSNEIILATKNKKYSFCCSKRDWENNTCSSYLGDGQQSSNTCTITEETNTCNWLMKLGTNPSIGNRDNPLNLLTQTNAGEIDFATISFYSILEDDLIKLPIYQWSYARCCEHNKKIYNINGDMITLKKDKDSVELFIYRYNKQNAKTPRRVTLISSKDYSLDIQCYDDENEIAAWTKGGRHGYNLLEKDMIRKYCDSLRCGISLPIEIEHEFSPFSFNDTPLRLIYEISYYEFLIAQKITFEPDLIATDEAEIETTSTPHVDPDYINDSQDVTTQDLKSDSDYTTESETKIETITSTTPVDEEAVRSNKVNPLIGVALTIITIVKSYFDLW